MLLDGIVQKLVQLGFGVRHGDAGIGFEVPASSTARFERGRLAIPAKYPGGSFSTPSTRVFWPGT